MNRLPGGLQGMIGLCDLTNIYVGGAQSLGVGKVLNYGILVIQVKGNIVGGAEWDISGDSTGQFWQAFQKFVINLACRFIEVEFIVGHGHVN